MRTLSTDVHFFYNIEVCSDVLLVTDPIVEEPLIWWLSVRLLHFQYNNICTCRLKTRSLCWISVVSLLTAAAEHCYGWSNDPSPNKSSLCHGGCATLYVRSSSFNCSDKVTLSLGLIPKCSMNIVQCSCSSVNRSQTDLLERMKTTIQRVRLFGPNLIFRLLIGCFPFTVKFVSSPF